MAEGFFKEEWFGLSLDHGTNFGVAHHWLARNYRIKLVCKTGSVSPAPAATSCLLSASTDLFSSSLRQVAGKAGDGSIINFKTCKK